MTPRELAELLRAHLGDQGEFGLGEVTDSRDAVADAVAMTVTHDQRWFLVRVERQFSAYDDTEPAPTMPDPKMTAVLFKDEAEVDGEVVGSVWLQYNDDTLRPYTWPRPFSSETEWVRLRRAREIAAEHGVDLVES